MNAPFIGGYTWRGRDVADYLGRKKNGIWSLTHRKIDPLPHMRDRRGSVYSAGRSKTVGKTQPYDLTYGFDLVHHESLGSSLSQRMQLGYSSSQTYAATLAPGGFIAVCPGRFF